VRNLTITRIHEINKSVLIRIIVCCNL